MRPVFYIFHEHQRETWMTVSRKWLRTHTDTPCQIGIKASTGVTKMTKRFTTTNMCSINLSDEPITFTLQHLYKTRIEIGDESVWDVRADTDVYWLVPFRTTLSQSRYYWQNVFLNMFILCGPWPWRRESISFWYTTYGTIISPFLRVILFANSQIFKWIVFFECI